MPAGSNGSSDARSESPEDAGSESPEDARSESPEDARSESPEDAGSESPEDAPVLVVRGRCEDADADRLATRALRDRVADTGQPAVRVWAPHRIVAFGRRDTRSDGFDAAAAAARDHGYAPVERSVGGRAVAYDGTTTLAFARITPIDDVRRGMDARYDALTSDLQRALRRLGVPAERGEPTDSFCPGQHSLQCDGKLAGIAQRVTQGGAITSGVLLVDDHDALASVLDAVYTALDVPFDADSVGSLARAGGTTDVDVVRDTLESELVGDRARRLVDVAALDGNEP